MGGKRKTEENDLNDVVAMGYRRAERKAIGTTKNSRYKSFNGYVQDTALLKKFNIAKEIQANALFLVNRKNVDSKTNPLKTIPIENMQSIEIFSPTDAKLKLGITTTQNVISITTNK